MFDGAGAAEIKQPVGNALATKGFAANKTEILTDIVQRRRAVERTFLQTRLKRFGTRRDCGQRIIYFMDDSRGKTAHGRELFEVINRTKPVFKRRLCAAYSGGPNLT